MTTGGRDRGKRKRGSRAWMSRCGRPLGRRRRSAAQYPDRRGGRATTPLRGGEGREEDPFDVVLYVSRGKILAMAFATDTKGARTRRQGKKKPQSPARGGTGSA